MYAADLPTIALAFVAAVILYLVMRPKKRKGRDATRPKRKR